MTSLPSWWVRARHPSFLPIPCTLLLEIFVSVNCLAFVPVNCLASLAQASDPVTCFTQIPCNRQRIPFWVDIFTSRKYP